MKILCVAQNEYALLDNTSTYDGLLTFGVQGCIVITAYAPQTQKKLLIHLDKNSSINEALSLLSNLIKEDSTLRVNVVKQLTDNEEHLINLTLLRAQEQLTNSQISFTNASTKTGTVVLMQNGTIRLDLQHMQNRSGNKHVLTIPTAGKPVFLNHELVVSPVLDVQWHITNFNSMLNEDKPLHQLLFQGYLNSEPELMDKRLISTLEELQKICLTRPNQTNTVQELVFEKLWAQYGKKNCAQLSELNIVEFNKHIQTIKPEEAPRVRQNFEQQLEVLCDRAKHQFNDFFVDIALHFLKQTDELKARHSPLKDGEPTTDSSYYTPLTYG